MIGIIDYGMGNLRSVQKALQFVGSQANILRHPDQINEVDRLVLPGVGAFADGMKRLDEGGWIEPLKQFVKAGKPFLGICLGMQLLFDTSQEVAEGTDAAVVHGLGLIAGEVLAFEGAAFGPGKLKVPHMGWNTLATAPGSTSGSGPESVPCFSPMFEGLGPQSSVYFVHGYYCHPTDESVVASWTEYGQRFCSSLRQDNMWASQFHPEKSQAVGLKMLGNFASCPH